MIAIIDYKVGNLVSVKKGLEEVGGKCCITSDPDVAEHAEKIVLPGVGHFAATEMLDRLGLSEHLRRNISERKPVLGICVGMQWLYEGSTEAPDTSGLGVLSGECRRFEGPLKCPHVGWNQLSKTGPSRLLHSIAENDYFYFTHSYYSPVSAETVASTEYGVSFAAVVERGNLFAVQFHPEKSGAAGLQLLRNFVELPC